METFEIFAFIRSVHGPLAGLSFLAVIISDLYGGSWVLGWKKYLNGKVLRVIHQVLQIGLGGLILTGLAMVVLSPQDYLLNITFWAKMFFVVVLLWNSFRIGKELEIPAGNMFTELSWSEKKHIFAVGGTSIISWVAALLLANIL